MNLAALKEDLIEDEGFSKHVYKDNLGYWTVGFGFCIDDRRKDCGLELEDCLVILDKKIQRIYNDFNRRLPWFHKLPDGRQRALCNMAYQMGVDGVMKFKKMMIALQHENYDAAYNEALSSKWATQTPDRAKRVALLIRNG